MARAPVVTHWSLPPQHAGYWTRVGGADGWPERGGVGPQPGPHIPGLVPGWHDMRVVPQRTGPAVRVPRGAMLAPRRTPRQPQSWRGLFNTHRAARRSGPAHWR